MTLLLGPPSSGKTTFLLALAGKLDSELKVNFTCNVSFGYDFPIPSFVYSSNLENPNLFASVFRKGDL